MRRQLWVGILSCFFIPFLLGCSGTRRLDRSDLVHPEPADTYLVTTQDGQTFTFIALHLEGDELIGTVRETVTNTVGEGETARTEISNRYDEKRVPWPEVALVEAEGGPKSSSGGVWLIAASVAAGIGAFLILGSTGDDNSGGSGGKDF
ncbi:MAG: hypothetical protein HKN21_16835 [Candidatus Eisenbacteria bacterium]|uniref:Uncharacterized protein n=1 Tax=Eiseniibacteriota bacterium TaxID=2212470 RepID=A0A7Y2EAV6_UNCEI|nr:hypothetical protein [Candidatus Eisenbacteria bacterium]